MSYIVMKDLRIVLDKLASVNIISQIKSWIYKRSTTNLLFFLLFVGSYFLHYQIYFILSVADWNLLKHPLLSTLDFIFKTQLN